MKTNMTILLALISLGILSCNSDSNSSLNHSTSSSSGSDDYYEAPVQLTEEELQQQLHDTECSNPAQYIDGTLSTQGRFKGVLSTKINGLKLTFNLSSSATLATIKNINVRISLLSKTGSVFHEQEITIYEFIKPGRSVTYKTEIDITNQQWKDLSETSWTIIGSECD